MVDRAEDGLYFLIDCADDGYDCRDKREPVIIEQETGLNEGLVYAYSTLDGRTYGIMPGGKAVYVSGGRISKSELPKQLRRALNRCTIIFDDDSSR